MKDKSLKLNNLPYHLAIILDGNGRWARKRGLSRSLGHQAGAYNIFKIVNSTLKLKIKMLTIFTFSTENFKRPKEEVDFLMELPLKLYSQYQDQLNSISKIKLVHVGSKDNLSNELVELINELEFKTKHNQGLILNIAFNYGSYEEINKAVVDMNRDNLKSFNKEDFFRYLYVKEPVDLLIRTSGEMRLSNFLLYQLAYAELYFTKKHWPAFKEKDLIKALKNYQKRKRRFGGIS